MQTKVWKTMVIVAAIEAGAPASAAVLNVPSQYSTIQSAFDVSAAGDTIVVANGTYTDTGNTYLWLRNRGGTTTSPITIQAATAGGVVLDGLNLQGANGVNDVILVDTTSSNIVIRGFEIKNGYQGGIQIYGSYNQIMECNIHHNGQANLTNPNGQNGIYSNPATPDNWYIANYIHNNGRISVGSDLDHGLYLSGDNEMLINNLIVANCEHGIQIAGGATVANMKIYNNTVVGNRNGSGIVLWGSMNGVDIANNIIYENGLAESGSDLEYGIRTSACTGSGVQIRNNLFYGNRDGAWNMTYGGSTVTYTTSGNITASDPQFVSSSNWHLQKCSPAIDSGLTLSTVADDYDALPRPIGTAYDMGAYER